VVVPQNQDAEVHVLGSLLAAGALGSDATATVLASVRDAGLSADDFYWRKRHGFVFEAIEAVAARGEPTDALLVREQLRNTGRLEAVGRERAIAELAAWTGVTHNAAHHARLVVDEARRRRLLDVGIAITKAARNGGLRDPEPLIERAVAALRDSQHPSTTPALPALTARELVARPDPPESAMLLGPLVVRGARIIVVGDTGHGKTTFVLQLATAVLTGGEMLGYEGAGVGPVVVVDLEQGFRTIKRTLREAGLTDRDDLIYVPIPDGLALDEAKGHREALAALVEELKPAVLVLDPYYKAHRADANEERAVVDLFRFLDALRAEHGFALVLPAHPRKDPASNGARKLSLHDVSGSGAVTRGAELVVGLERVSHGYARLRILKDRDGDLPVGEAWPLIFSRDGGFRHDPKEEEKAEDLEERLLAHAGAWFTVNEQKTQWLTVKDWKTELGVGEERAREMLDRLCETGHVEKEVGPPGRSPNAKCYRVSELPRGSQGTSGQLPEDKPAAESAPTAPALIENTGAEALAQPPLSDRSSSGQSGAV